MILDPSEVLSRLNSSFGTSLSVNPDLSNYTDATLVNELGYVLKTPPVANENTVQAVPSESTTLPDVTNDSTATNMIEALQQNSVNSNSHTARFTTAVDNQNKLLEEQNKFSAEHNNLLKEQIKMQSTELAQQSKRNEILNNLVNSMAILQSESLIKMQELTETLANKNMSPTVNNNVATPTVNVSAPTVNNTVNLDTSKIEASTQTISNAINEIKTANQSIAEVGQLKKEEIEFNKNGNPELKDSNGTVIKPREANAKRNAEQLIEQEEMNKTTIDEVIELTGDLFSFAGDLADEGAEMLGVKDGMSLDFNPMDYVFKILKEDSKQDLLKEQALPKGDI